MTRAGDVAKLRHVAVVLAGDAADRYDAGNTPLAKAFTQNGIIGFNMELLALNDQEITNLAYREDPNNANSPYLQLNLGDAKKIVAAVKAFHHYSAIQGALLDVKSIQKATYDNFRLTLMDPSKPIIPWQVLKSNLEAAATKSLNDDLTNWKKSIKPNRSEFKEFKDDAYWPRHKKHFTETLEAQGLAHTIDETFTPTNNDLDESQLKWTYKTMKDTLVAPKAKTIILDHEATKDCRAIWKALNDHYDKSTSTDMRVMQISTYLSSTKYHQSNWRGTMSNFVIHYREQIRLFNEISPDPLGDPQCIRLARTVFHGVPEMAVVWNNHINATKSAGVTATWSFEEYISALLQQAAILDAGNTYRTNPRASKREANQHIFADDEDVNDEYDVMVHDVDTPIEELMVNQGLQTPANGQPQRVMLDRDVYRSLSIPDLTVSTGDRFRNKASAPLFHASQLTEDLSNLTVVPRQLAFPNDRPTNTRRKSKMIIKLNPLKHLCTKPLSQLNHLTCSLQPSPTTTVSTRLTFAP